QWFRDFQRILLAGEESRSVVDPQEQLGFLVTETMRGFQLGNADIVRWTIPTPALDILGDQLRLHRRLGQNLRTLIGIFDQATPDFADPDPALAAFSTLFYKAKSEQGVDVFERRGKWQAIPTCGGPSCSRILQRDRHALGPGPFVEIVNKLDTPGEAERREICGPSRSGEQCRAPLRKAVAINQGRNGFVGNAYRLSINCRFWRI